MNNRNTPSWTLTRQLNELCNDSMCLEIMYGEIMVMITAVIYHNSYELLFILIAFIDCYYNIKINILTMMIYLTLPIPW